MPGIFAQLHPKRYRTPWFTIVVFSVFAGILLIPGKTDFLGNLYSFGAMLSFTTAHAAVDRAADQGSRPRAARTGCRGTSDSAARSIPITRGHRRDRDVRRVGLGDGAARRRPLRRDAAGWSSASRGYVDLPTQRHGMDLTSHYKIAAPRAPGVLHRARVPLGDRADLRHRRRRRRRCARPPSSWARARPSRRCTCCGCPTSCRSTPASRRRSSSG